MDSLELAASEFLLHFIVTEACRPRLRCPGLEGGLQRCCATADGTCHFPSTDHLLAVVLNALVNESTWLVLHRPCESGTVFYI